MLKWKRLDTINSSILTTTDLNLQFKLVTMTKDDDKNLFFHFYSLCQEKSKKRENETNDEKYIDIKNFDHFLFS